MAIKKETSESILLPRIRAVNEKDHHLSATKFSHSRLESFENCPMAYYNKYVLKKTDPDESAIALEVGTLLHAVLEHKGYMLTGTYGVDYERLESMLVNGIDEWTEKTSSHIPGLKELKKKYWETWMVPDPEGRTYDDKMANFREVVKTEMEDDAWKPLFFEYPFEFIWKDEPNGEEIILHGFIDRVDYILPEGEHLWIGNDEGKLALNPKVRLRVVDYKTSRKVFDDKKIKTSQQFGIYALAILNEFGIVPEQYLYRFICINESQYALSKGWEKRLIKKLDKVFGALKESETTGIYKPSPTPLCHWCNYSDTNPNAKKFKDECPFHSMWTREAPDFRVAQEFTEDYFKKPKKRVSLFDAEKPTKRALVF